MDIETLSTIVREAGEDLAAHDKVKNEKGLKKLAMAADIAKNNDETERGGNSGSSGARPLIATAIGIVAAVAAVVGTAATLMDSRISDLGARVSTVEARLINIDAGIADLRVQSTSIAGELRAINRTLAKL